MNRPLAETLDKIKNDPNIRQNVPSSKLLIEVADCYLLYGYDETMKRLETAERSRQRNRNHIKVAKIIVQYIDESEYIRANPQVGRLLIKTVDKILKEKS